MNGGERSVVMSGELVTSGAWSFPLMRFSSLVDDDSWLKQSGVPSGLSITEDTECIYVDVALPGVKIEDIDISYHNGVLSILGEMKDEERSGRKSYHQMTSSYSYQVAVPGEVDSMVEPEATCVDGILTITFSKLKAATPKKIVIKSKTSIARGKKNSDEKEDVKSEEKEAMKAGAKTASKTDLENTQEMISNPLNDSAVAETPTDLPPEESEDKA